MSFTFRERYQSRRTSSNPPTYESGWVAVGEEGSNTVKVNALLLTPGTIAVPEGLLFRQDVLVEPTEAKDAYYVTVPYAARKQIVGEYRLSFDTGGGTIKISNSKQSIYRYGVGVSEAGASAATAIPKYDGAIGVDMTTGEVAGTDIVIPALRITVNFKYPAGVITLAQIKNFARWTGLVNSDTFLTFDPGEVLFLGATGSEGTDAETEVALQYAMSQNATGLSIGDIAGIAKKGWELVWIRYTEDTSAGYSIKKPKFVYVERVYDTLAMSTAFGF